MMNFGCQKIYIDVNLTDSYNKASTKLICPAPGKYIDERARDHREINIAIFGKDVEILFWAHHDI